MALDPRFIIAGDLQEFFVDKDTGLPMAAGVVTFYKDSSRNVGKPVYQITGSPPNYTYTALPNPITLSGVGTVQNAGGDDVVIYYFPYQGTPDNSNGELELYYITIENSDSDPQFTREAWPNVTSVNDTESFSGVDNQISNSQFTRMFLNDTIANIITVSGDTTVPIGPDWTLVASGSGTVTLTRIAIAGTDNITTSPPYVLDVELTAGVTTCFIRQRMFTNSGLWASTVVDSDENSLFLTGTILAKNVVAGTAQLTMTYLESSGNAAQDIFTQSFGNSDYTVISGFVEVDQSLDTNTGTSAYVDIYISFLPSAHVQLTSIQLIPSSSQSGAEITAYQPLSSNREQALMGDYYIPALEAKPIKSMLVGWDFPINPAQFGLAANITTTPAYIADQTIAASVTNPAGLTRNTITNGLQYITGAAADAVYFLQYMTGDQVKKILATQLSVNVNAYTKTSSNNVTCKVYLFRGNSSSSVPTLATTIGTLAVDGTFTLTGGNNWSVITRQGLPTATGTLKYVTADNADINTGCDLGFNGWIIDDSTQMSSTKNFAVVVTLASSASTSQVVINSISVVPGVIPTRPAPQTQDEVLRECEYYYEKSYETSDLPGTVTAAASLVKQMQLNGQGSYAGGTLVPSAFSIEYAVPKVTTPSLTIYDEAGTSDSVTGYAYKGGQGIASVAIAFSTNWSAGTQSEKAAHYVPSTSNIFIARNNGGSSYDAFISVHYVADSRLGIV